MSVDLHAVKVADTAISPAIADPTAAAAYLMTHQTYTAQAVSVKKAVVHGILFEASTGDWLRIMARADLSFSSGYPNTPIASDAPIAAAKMAVALAASDITEIDPTGWADFLAQIAALVAAGDVSTATQTAITALGTIQVPQWSETLTGGIVQTARAQP